MPLRLILPVLAFAGIAFSQQRGPAGPPPMSCGAHGAIEILCGTRSPEDLEPTPDGKYLIVSQFVNGRGSKGAESGAGLVLFDIAKKTYSPLTAAAEPRKDWGDANCPGAPGDALIPHGISLTKRSGGAEELYVVNHGAGRESIEMFELKRAGGSWGLAWHGCVTSKYDFNDVAALPDGSFIATHPTSMRAPGAANTDLFNGAPSGWVARWTAKSGETELPGTRAGYPNGVLATADGRTMYFNAWTAKEVHRYDLKAEKETGVVKLEFMPDNITWTPQHTIVAAGVKGVRGDCPAGSGEPCIQGFEAAEIDPAKFQARTVFDSHGQGALISGVSVALKVGNSMYFGAFQGDRLVRAPWKK